jgi:peptide/nickel transport system permease protein
LFVVLLSFVSFLLTDFRVKDQSYQYADSSISQEDIEAMQKNRGFVSSLFSYYGGLFYLDFGMTLSGENVLAHISKRLPPSLVLSLVSVCVGSALGIFLGLTCVYTDRIWFPKLVLGFAGMILSTPIFVVSVVLLLIFFVKLGLLPPGGYKHGDISYIILPAAALGSRVFARMVYYTYSEGLKEKLSEYSVLLQARGFSQLRIIYKHIFLKVFPLLFVFILIDFSSLLSGAIIVEEIFLFPGIGKSMYYAIKTMDQNLLRAILLYSGLVFYISTRTARYISAKALGN